jgi:hypothetical protein
MKGKFVFILGMSAVLGLSQIALCRGAKQAQMPDNVKVIFKHNCGTSACHSGKNAPAGLNLEPANLPASVVGIASREKPDLRIVDPAAPEKSYLLAKIKGEPGIVGKRMPANRDPLTVEEIRQVEDWIKSLAANPSKTEASSGSGSPGHGPALAASSDLGEDAGQAGKAKAISKPAFWGTTLVNLPTTTTLSKGEFQFRISHRFQPPISSGWDSFYGLDGPAYILFSFGYGITDKLMVSVARSRLYQEWDFNADWAIIEQGKKSSLPFSVTFHAGGSLVSQDEPQAVDWSGRFRINALLSLCHQLNDRISLLVVPAFSSNTNFWEANSEGTFGLGIGGRFMVIDDLSFIAEWVPVLAGYADEYSGWGVGLEKKIGGHVFQLFVTDSIGIIASQYLPGGDLRLGDGDFRIGFNIFRTF